MKAVFKIDFCFEFDGVLVFLVMVEWFFSRKFVAVVLLGMFWSAEVLFIATLPENDVSNFAVWS